MSDRDLKCIHCYENLDDYGNQVDAEVVFDGLSLCFDHYHVHRDRTVMDFPSMAPVRVPAQYIGEEPVPPPPQRDLA